MDYRRYVEYMSLTPMSALQVVIAGFLTGIAAWLLIYGMQNYALEPVLCNGANTASCKTAPGIALFMGLGVAHFIGLIVMMRMNVLRPLLVVLASILTMWGFQTWIYDVPLWQAVIYCGLLFGLTYGFYAWVNRLLIFPVALTVTLVAVIVSRLFISSW